MEKNKKMRTMSVYEASDFWDEHEFGEFKDIKEVKNIRFSLRKRKYVGIDENLFFMIKNRAKELNMAEDVLINEWLQEKVKI